MTTPNDNGWNMPQELEPYRDSIDKFNSASVEDMMNMRSETGLFNSNVHMWIRVRMVEAQVGLLLELQRNGLLATKPERKKGGK